MENCEHLLSVRGLSVSFENHKGDRFDALKRVSLDIGPGESVGLVGESGSGKSVLARSLIGVLPDSSTMNCDEMLWKEEMMSTLTPSKLRQWRREQIAVIWQNPQASLVPVYRVGQQMQWLLRLCGVASRKKRESQTLELFSRVGFRDPERIAQGFPEELSGGECQRVMVAMALARRPQLLIADEPTSNLDVKLQSEIIRLIEDLRRELKFSLLFITHDLAIASRITDRTVVLYQGSVVEEGATLEVLRRPKHAYTKSLISSATLEIVGAHT